jgi:hypothetical protein
VVGSRLDQVGMAASYQAWGSVLGAAFPEESEVAFLQEVVETHHLVGLEACKEDTRFEEELLVQFGM